MVVVFVSHLLSSSFFLRLPRAWLLWRWLGDNSWMFRQVFMLPVMTCCQCFLTWHHWESEFTWTPLQTGRYGENKVIQLHQISYLLLCPAKSTLRKPWTNWYAIEEAELEITEVMKQLCQRWWHSVYQSPGHCWGVLVDSSVSYGGSRRYLWHGRGLYGFDFWMENRVPTVGVTLPSLPRKASAWLLH